MDYDKNNKVPITAGVLYSLKGTEKTYVRMILL